MNKRITPIEDEVARLIDEQVELAVTRIPALSPGLAHPSPVDHDEQTEPHPDMEAVLLGTRPATPGMLEELQALEGAEPLTDEELARQALDAGGSDGDPSTAE